MDWFKKQTKDLLFQKQVPKYNGGGTYWVNQGKLNNTGVEMSLTTFPVKGAVTWETSLNASYVKNEVADLAGDDFVLTANYSDFGRSSADYEARLSYGISLCLSMERIR